MKDDQFDRLYRSLIKIAQETEKLTGCGVLIAFGIHEEAEPEGNEWRIRTNREGAYTTPDLEWGDAAKLCVGITGIISDHYGNGEPWEADTNPLTSPSGDNV